MRKKNLNKYSEASKSLIKKCASYEELQKKVMEKFKVRNKRDKGWDSIRKAAKREWDKKEKEMKRIKKVDKKGGQGQIGSGLRGGQ